MGAQDRPFKGSPSCRPHRWLATSSSMRISWCLTSRLGRGHRAPSQGTAPSGEGEPFGNRLGCGLRCEESTRELRTGFGAIWVHAPAVPCCVMSGEPLGSSRPPLPGWGWGDGPLIGAQSGVCLHWTVHEQAGVPRSTGLYPAKS